MSASSVKLTNLFASIDMGTNSFKLIIIQFQPSSSKFTTLLHHSSPVVLGRTVSPSSPPFISPDSTSRAVETLTEFHDILLSYGTLSLLSDGLLNMNMGQSHDNNNNNNSNVMCTVMGQSCDNIAMGQSHDNTVFLPESTSQVLAGLSFDDRVSILRDRLMKMGQSHDDTESHLRIRTRVVGTSAIREASNSKEFILEVGEKLGFGFDVDLISGVEEGRLIYKGVLQFLPVYDKRVLIFDIGGGSTEFVIGENGEVVYVESLKLGHVTLTQKFKGGDLVGLMRGYVCEVIRASGLVGKVKDLGFEIGIGSSGTIRAIEKAIWCGYGSDGREVKKGGSKRKWWWLSREDLRVFVEKLCRGMDDEEERIRRDVFFGRRSEFIVAGAVILDVIMELLEISEIRVSRYALGEGVVAQMVSESFPGCDLNANVRWKSVVRFAMRFNGKDRMKKGVQCAAIAKEIFEGLKGYNDAAEIHSTEVFLQEKDLEYLEAACMLHNIGIYYSKEGYHKRSCSIIMGHGELDGFTTKEIELIARLARHHRKKFPSVECSSLQELSGEVKQKFGILCSILRISVIIQKDKILKHKAIKFFHAHEGFLLAFIEKEDLQQHPHLQKSIADDFRGKIAKEAELFEAVYHKKILVVGL